MITGQVTTEVLPFVEQVRLAPRIPFLWHEAKRFGGVFDTNNC